MAAYDVKLAPHGKATMGPALFQRQIEHRAPGVSPWRCARRSAPPICTACGAVLMANQLVGKKANVALSKQRPAVRDPAFTFCCLVQFGRGARANWARTSRRAGTSAARAGRAGPGRPSATGVRDLKAALQRPCWTRSGAEARSALATGRRGESYEGVLKEEDDIRRFLRRAADTLRATGRGRPAAPRQPTRCSRGAGSAWVRRGGGGVQRTGYRSIAGDRAAAPRLLPDATGGILHAAPPSASRRTTPWRAAWPPACCPPCRCGPTCLVECPKPGRAHRRAGQARRGLRRGLPVPSPALPLRLGRGRAGRCRRTGSSPRHDGPAPPSPGRLRRGRRASRRTCLAFDISHPCLTFDKWRQVLLVDAGYSDHGRGRRRIS